MQPMIVACCSRRPAIRRGRNEGERSGTKGEFAAFARLAALPRIADLHFGLPRFAHLMWVKAPVVRGNLATPPWQADISLLSSI